MPLISVVVPTHNRPEMLAEALASVKMQTLSDYEVVVVSNGENAEMRSQSLAVAAAHGARYFTLDKGNLPAARNFGIERAAGQWIAFLDDDDIWLPHKLERQLNAVTSSFDLVTCDYVIFWPNGREAVTRVRPPAGWSYLKAISHIKWCSPPSCVIVRKSALAAAGGFDPHQRFGEDNEMWFRLALRGGTIQQLDDVLVRYRAGHPSITSANKRPLQMYRLRFFFKVWCSGYAGRRSVVAFVFSRLALRLLAIVARWPRHGNNSLPTN